MPKSTQIQSRVTACRISAIAKDLANGKTRGDILAKYGKKWQLSSRSIDRLIEKAKEQAQTLRDLAANTAKDTLVEEVKEAVKQGLKTKTERLLILQKEVDACIEELSDGVDEEEKKAKRLTVLEKVALRKTIKELQSEISKIEGDYAPTKIAPTDPKGNKLPAIAPIVFLSADKLTDQQLQQFLNANETKEDDV